MNKPSTADVARHTDLLCRADDKITRLEARTIEMPVTDRDEILGDVFDTLAIIKAVQTETIDLRPLPPHTDPEPFPPGSAEVIGRSASLEDRVMRVFDRCGHAKS